MHRFTRVSAVALVALTVSYAAVLVAKDLGSQSPALPVSIRYVLDRAGWDAAAFSQLKDFAVRALSVEEPALSETPVTPVTLPTGVETYFAAVAGGGAPSYNEIALEKNVLYFQRDRFRQKALYLASPISFLPMAMTVNKRYATSTSVTENNSKYPKFHILQAQPTTAIPKAGLRRSPRRTNPVLHFFTSRVMALTTQIIKTTTGLFCGKKPSSRFANSLAGSPLCLPTSPLSQ